jgi:hypothetical protein
VRTPVKVPLVGAKFYLSAGMASAKRVTSRSARVTSESKNVDSGSAAKSGHASAANNKVLEITG